MQIKKCKQNEMDKKEIKKGIPVYLNVYNISGVNYFFQIFGLGIFHTGVEITDREYSFGSTDRDYSGVIAIRPGSLGFQVKEKIYLGNTLYNMDEIRYLSTLISFIWRGLTYDPFSKNCNSFTKFFAECLLKSSVNYPNYINRFTLFKTIFSCLYHPFKSIVGDIVQMKPEQTYKDVTREKIIIQDIKQNKIDSVVEKEKSEDEESENETIKEVVKVKPIRKTQKARMIRRLKRYKVKTEDNDNIRFVLKNENAANQVTNVISNCNTQILTHKEFFKNFDKNILEKFESHRIDEVISVKNSPKFLIEENDSTTFLKYINNLSDFTVDIKIYENFEDITNIVNCKNHEKNYSVQKRKLFLLNNLVKYLKISSKLCSSDKNYEKALIFYKYCLEITEELLHFIKKGVPEKTREKLNKCSNMNDYEETKVINENSINLEFSSDDHYDYSPFYDGKDFLCKTLIKIIHSIIFCNQKLFLYDEIKYYCDKILTIDNTNWEALLKRGIQYYLHGEKIKAESDFSKALEYFPDKEQLRIELEKLNFST